MSELRMMANRIDEGVCESTGKTSYGVFIDVLVQLLPVFLQLFQNCPKKPKPPAPVNPNPSPTAEQAKAWDDAWGLKCRAVDGYNEDEADYTPKLLRQMSHVAMRDKRRKGEKISKAEAMHIGRESLDEARTSEMRVLAAAVLEAQPIVLTLPPLAFHVVDDKSADDDE